MEGVPVVMVGQEGVKAKGNGGLAIGTVTDVSWWCDVLFLYARFDIRAKLLNDLYGR